MPPAIHITGASGSGVSTLGRGLAERTGAVHLDTDDFYWAPLEPKYSVKRGVPERLRLLRSAFEAAEKRGFVLSGSVGAWADSIVPRFGLVVFLEAPAETRAARLRHREAEEFGGAAIAPGGARHEEHEAFVAWAMQYDAGPKEGRSRARHEAWLRTLRCPVLRLDGIEPADRLVERVVETHPEIMRAARI
jgi:adenylate kinase family enzyme